jgi:hypothetical protein
VLALQPGVRELDVMGLNAMSPNRWADVVEVAANETRKRLARSETTRLLTRLAG